MKIKPLYWILSKQKLMKISQAYFLKASKINLEHLYLKIPNIMKLSEI